MERRSWNIFGTLGVVLTIGLIEILNLGLSVKILFAAVATGYFVSKHLGRSGGYGALFGGLIGLILLGAIHGYETRTQRAAELQAVKKEIAELNATLPQMVRGDLRIDRISLGEDEIQYFATYVDATIDEIDIDAVQVEHGEYVGNLSCETTDDQIVFADDLKYHFYYFDMNDAPVVDFTVTKANCQ